MSFEREKYKSASELNNHNYAMLDVIKDYVTATKYSSLDVNPLRHYYARNISLST